MPMLPSGRHVALDPAPLYALLNHPEIPSNVHHIMALKAWDDLQRWIDVTYLVPEAEAGGDFKRLEFANGSSPAPPGFVAVLSGFRLAKLEDLTRDWTEADRQAMREFIEQRAVGHFSAHLEQAAEAQARLRHSGDFVQRALAAWHDLGAHPAQEEEWDAEEEAQWDTYDAIAAIACSNRALHLLPEVPEGYEVASARAAAFIHIVANYLPDPDGNFGMAPREIAASWRKQQALDAVDPGKAEWIRNQAVIECTVLWEAGDELKQLAPKAFAILELVALSKEGAEIPR